MRETDCFVALLLAMTEAQNCLTAVISTMTETRKITVMLNSSTFVFASIQHLQMQL